MGFTRWDRFPYPSLYLLNFIIHDLLTNVKKKIEKIKLFFIFILFIVKTNT